MLNFGFYNMDCMEGMKEFPDKYFDIAIVDPPYFKEVERSNYFGKDVSSTNVKRLNHHSEHWGIPDKQYFDELFRVSKEQIIWGCNYYNYTFPKSGRLIWDKVNDSSTFSNCEIAYCSLIDSVKIFRYMWNGMLQQDMKHKEKRIHSTQKPIALYSWITDRYTKPEDIILDTHVGSASSLIAFHRMKRKYVGFEIDEYYYDLAKKRFNEETAQMTIYDYIQQ